MKKDVKIAIRGLQLGEEIEKDEIETITEGEFYEKNGSYYLIFEEIMDGTTTKSILKFDDRRLLMSKSGAVQVAMDFEKDRKTYSSYRTPFGTFMLGIDTTRMNLTMSETSLEIEIVYGIEVNEQYIAESHIRIRAME